MAKKAKKGEVTTTKSIAKKEDKEEKEAKEATKKSIPQEPPKKVKVAEPKNKKVTVIPKFTGKRFIASDWYEFEEEIKKKVPKHVADLLKDRRMVYL